MPSPELGEYMQRREFITLLGGATAWPLAARAQQPAMPALGLLYGGTFDGLGYLLPAFRQGLRQNGYIEGRNLAVRSEDAKAASDRDVSPAGR
jgi:hypothetical protein